MSFEQTRDLLHRASEFHRTLGRYFKTHRSRLHQERVKMLMDYLSRQENNLAKALERYERDASPAVLNTWFQYTSPPLTANSLDIRDDMSFDEVVQQVMEFDECLVSMYRDMADSADIPEVKELFDDLLNMENTERQHRSRLILSLQQDM